MLQPSEEVSTNQLGHVDKITHEDTVGRAFESFAEKIDAFILHQYIKRRQSEKFEDSKKEVSNTTAVLQVDYAENFSVVLQNEVQSRHWVNEQISLFTGSHGCYPIASHMACSVISWSTANSVSVYASSI